MRRIQPVILIFKEDSQFHSHKSGIHRLQADFLLSHPGFKAQVRVQIIHGIDNDPRGVQLTVYRT